MNKLIGYTELNVNGESIPVKFGLKALELFIKEYGIKFSELPDLFEITVVAGVGTDKQIQGILPKDLIKFLTTSIWAGANYVAQREGKGEDYYSLENVYDWIDEIGITNPECMKIIKTFSAAILNGGTLPKEIDQQESEDTNEIKKKSST